MFEHPLVRGMNNERVSAEIKSFLHVSIFSKPVRSARQSFAIKQVFIWSRPHFLSSPLRDRTQKRRKSYRAESPRSIIMSLGKVKHYRRRAIDP